MKTLISILMLCSTGIPAWADEPQPMPRPLLGVQRWDMYSGEGATQQQELGYLPGKQGFLKPAEWHDRAPFFVRRTEDVESVEHPAGAGPLWFNHPFDRELLQQSMDQEIRYAHNAGIDFFIYHGPARKVVGRGAWGLMNNLDAHIASGIPEAKKMKFVWALYGHKAIGYTRDKVTRMMDETIPMVKMPNWQKVMDDRPLIIVMWPGQFRQQLARASGDQAMTGAEFTRYLRERVKAAGLRNPYLVGCIVPAKSFRHADELKKDGYDAFMDYAGGYGGAVGRRDDSPTYAEATASLLETLERDYLGRGLPFIPSCTSMHYPWPRALDKKTGKPVEKWYHYQWPKRGDLADRVNAVFDFVEAHPKACEARVVSMYSWNECSEGGGLIPTMGKAPDYQPVTTWFDEVAGALASYGAGEERQDDGSSMITIDASATARPYDRMIFGGFLEHFDNQVYGGVFEPGSPLADEAGFRTDVLDALKELKMPVIRWPGGCFVDAYHWQKGVGETREPYGDFRWGVIEPNTFGTHEFVELCRRIGAEPYICFNGLASPRENLDWVAYCNATEGEFAEMRKANGHPEPFKVKFWSVGNERYDK